MVERDGPSRLYFLMGIKINIYLVVSSITFKFIGDQFSQFISLNIFDTRT